MGCNGRAQLRSIRPNRAIRHRQIATASKQMSLRPLRNNRAGISKIRSPSPMPSRRAYTGAREMNTAESNMAGYQYESAVLHCAPNISIRRGNVAVSHCAPSISNAQLRLSASALLVARASLRRGPVQHEPRSHVQWSTARLRMHQRAARHHRSSTKRSAWSMARIWSGPISLWRDDSRSTETTRSWSQRA